MRRKDGRLVHICVASSTPVLSKFGGAIQRRIWETAIQQVDQGHQVTVYSVGVSHEEVKREGVELVYVPTRLAGSARHFEYLARVFVHESRRPRPAVYNVHSEPEAVLGARFRKTPSILFYDYFAFRGGKFVKAYSRLLEGFDVLAPCSEYCASESLRYWNFSDAPPRMRVVHNGVNLEQFCPDLGSGALERSRLGLTGEVVLYVGRVNEQKGTDLLLEAFSRIASPGRTLVIAGPIGQFSGARPGEERVWRDRMSIEGVRYLGAVEEERLSAVYNMADVFVMPTLELEMFGMAAVEAQACGVPVIASDHGGLRETVPLDVGGRFSPGDPKSLSEQLEHILGSASLRAACSDNARRSAERFGWSTIAGQLETIYQGLPRRN